MKCNRPRSIARFACLLTAAALLVPAPLLAQRPVLKSDKSVASAFRDVVARPSFSVVRILCDGKEAAMGTVVGEDGWIITKASELKGKLAIKLRDGKTRDALIQGVEERYDLAMLKVELVGLKPIVWASSKTAEVGDWLATPGAGDDLPLSVGVVSVAAREPRLGEMPAPTPKGNSGYMGVQLADEEGAPTIGRVEPKSAAEKAGLKIGDVVLTVQGKVVTDVERLIATIQTFKAGDIVQLKIKRDGKERDMSVTLGQRPKDSPNRGDMQNSMGSTLSARRGGFPHIMQSDLVLKPTECGAPWVNLDGKAVGIAIARAGRTESYAIPSDQVQALLSDLKSGKLKPKEPLPVVNIKELEDAVTKAKTVVEAKQKELKVAEDDENSEEEAVKKLQGEAAALKKKLDEARKALDSARKDATKKD